MTLPVSGQMKLRFNPYVFILRDEGDTPQFCMLQVGYVETLQSPHRVNLMPLLNSPPETLPKLA